MLEQILKSTGAILIACLLLPGCSHFSESARKQAAYQKYVRKHMTAQAKLRAKYRAKYKSPKTPPPTSAPSQANVAVKAGDGPQSVTSNQ